MIQQNEISIKNTLSTAKGTDGQVKLTNIIPLAAFFSGFTADLRKFQLIFRVAIKARKLTANKIMYSANKNRPTAQNRCFVLRCSTCDSIFKIIFVQFECS